MHRVKGEVSVEAGFDSRGAESTPWRARTAVSDAAEVGTEVAALMMSHRSLSPYVVGRSTTAVDKPTPYKNDDESNDRRVFES